jgi:hypothetical protein
VRTRLAVTVLVVALAGAGCGAAGSSGGDATRQYVEALNRAQGRFAATVSRLSQRVTTTSSAARDRSTLRAFDGAVVRVVSDLRRISPPARVAGLHGRLVAELRGFDAELRRATRAIDSHDAGRVRAAQRRLRAATAQVARRLKATIGAINDRLRA